MVTLIKFDSYKSFMFVDVQSKIHIKQVQRYSYKTSFFFFELEKSWKVDVYICKVVYTTKIWGKGKCPCYYTPTYFRTQCPLVPTFPHLANQLAICKWMSLSFLFNLPIYIYICPSSKQQSFSSFHWFQKKYFMWLHSNLLNPILCFFFWY